MIKKIISGGQIGADIAGLRAAQSLGVSTGGWMPKGWWTKDGSRPIYKELYGMEECPTLGYPARTSLNVIDSQGTIRLAYNFSSRGEICTMKAIRTHMRTHLDVVIVKSDVGYYIPDRLGKIEDAAEWINGQQIAILNVAGNADKGIEHLVEAFMSEVIRVDAQLST